MPLRPPAGFIRPGFDPLKNPDAPTAVEATGGDASASVTFTPPGNVGGSAISAYYAVSNPDQITASAASSPISVTGLTNGTAYTFAVWALNTYGPGPFSAASGSVTPNTFAFFGGGSKNGSRTNDVQRVAFSTSGNAASFASLTQARSYIGACSSSTRGVWAGGRNTNDDDVNTIDFITMASGGGGSDFGDLTVARIQPAGASNNTRGMFAGGLSPAQTVIDYITIASTGNAISFGSLPVGIYGAGGCASSTRAVWLGGSTSGGDTGRNSIYYVTIATTGNAVSFGELTYKTLDTTACSNSTRGLVMGGRSGAAESPSVVYNTIEYITIASTGNSTDFGDLTQATQYLASAASSTYAIRSGGANAGSATNVMDYVTIATTGNAVDFGDMSGTFEQHAGCSSGHGGL
jgi:hypothetical protein